MESLKKIITTLLMMVIVVIITVGCSARKGMPYSEPLTLESQQLKNGEILFNGYCNSCHPGGSSGLAPALNNKPLPAFLIRFQVRNGVGTMPAFEEKVLSDDEVKNIAKYVVYLRKNG